jgi:glyoxylase-like metal-dependent hydrolase (beta-lactamase superfamily II)/8-oxo-dGTP pyrophosphatase MutT (NUDIX family)
MVETKTFRDAACVVLIRGYGSSLEVFWVRRSDAVPFQPGFMAFPGGKVDAADAAFDVPGVADDFERAARVCAVREALEETGVLLAHAGAADPNTVSAARAALLEGRVTLADVAREHGWALAPESLTFAGRWQTPVFAPVRFDTLFFLSRLPEGQEPTVIPGELAGGEWVQPLDALARYRKGELTFAAPILWTLIALAEGEQDLAERIAQGPTRAATPVRRVELQWGVVLHAMPTKPLPPALFTNAYLLGEREMALVDPGSGEPEHLRELFTLIEHLESEGRRLKMIVVTHHHPDHTGGVQACRERFGAQVVGHELLARHLAVDVVVKDGDWLPLAPGLDDWMLQVLETPGHTRDSISLWHPKRHALFCGDLLPGGAGTVIIDPPDGDMTAYLASLEACASLEPATLFPAHGSPTGAAVRRIRALIRHRLEREEKVFGALANGVTQPASLAELLPIAYADTPRELWGFAERSLLAHLEKLERDGRALRSGDAWRAA